MQLGGVSLDELRLKVDGGSEELGGRDQGTGRMGNGILKKWGMGFERMGDGERDSKEWGMGNGI